MRHSTDRREHSPALSVVIACFNDGHLLGEAVESVQATCDERCEMVVVDDGSDDPFTLSALDRLRESRTRVITRPHAGLPAARNAGIAATSGRYILPLDADNHLLAGYAAIGIELLDREPGVGVVYGDAELFGRRRGMRRPGELDVRAMLRTNRIDACAVFRRELWSQCGGYDEAIAAGPEDWDLWLSAIERGWEFRYVPRTLFAYRVREDSLSDRLVRLPAAESPARRIAERHSRLYRHPEFYGASPASALDRLLSRRPALHHRLRRLRSAPLQAAVGARRALRSRFG